MSALLHFLLRSLPRSVRAELGANVKALRAELYASVRALRAELDASVKASRMELERNIITPPSVLGRGLTWAGRAIILAGLLFVLFMTDDGGYGNGPRTEDQAVMFQAEPDVADVEPDAAPAPTPAPTAVPPSTAAITRLQIPRLGVDANVVALGIDPDGAMQAPKTPVDVGWYGFTRYPGNLGNAVFAGHLDYANYGPAVFWRLSSLKEGDEVRVRLADNTAYAYQVVFTAMYSADDAPLDYIIGPTENEVITLITCGGTFNYRTREYDKRVIVRAERVRA